jgi:neutral ceramidase
MIKYTLVVLTFALTVSRSEARLRAGAAIADITPQEWPIRVVGNFGLTLAKSAHDNLHARALVLDDGVVKIAIALVDSCYVKRREMDRIKAVASGQTRIPASRILLAATHTHSAPPSAAAEGNEIEQRYVERLVSQTAAAIVRANERLVPAKIGWSVVAVPDELFNRRWFLRSGAIPPNPFGETNDVVRMNPVAGSADLIHPAGGTDPGLSIVFVQDDAGKPVAVLANYSLHYVGGVPGPDVSADYFGEFARRLTSRIAPNDSSFVAMLSNGTSGDVNNIDFVHPRPRSEPYQRVTIVADKVAGRVAEALSRIEYRSELPVRMVEREVSLRYRRGTPEQMAFGRKALQEQDEKTLPQNAKAYAARLLELEQGPDMAQVKLQAIRIGELGIAAIPCEVFTETGLTIKELSPFRPTFTIELANGHYGYLPTTRHFALGGYETWPGTNLLEREASVSITDTILGLLRALHGRK